MRNSAIEKKKTMSNVKFNKRRKTDEFSDVSEEGSLDKSEELNESLD